MAYLVGIDCGHGMYTDGKRTPRLKEDIKINGKIVKKKGEIIHENEWNRAVGKYLAKALNRCGINTYYTSDMSGKTDTPLSTRASRANARKCDILVSCHYNAYGGCSNFLDRKGGLLVLRTKNCSSNSIKLGKLVAEQLYKDIDYKYNYGLMRDVDMSGFTLAILRQTNMPSILIEYGFMDVWNEAKKMVDPAHQKACAESTAKAICKYFGVTYKKEAKKTVDRTGEKDVPNYTVQVLVDSLNVRYGASTSYDIIKSIKKGEKVVITHEKDGWGLIQEAKGWINLNKEYIKKIIETPKPITPITKTTYYRVITGSYAVRDNAVDEQNKLKKLGYDAYLVSKEINKKDIYSVVAEVYTNKSEAEKLIKELNKKGFDCFIELFEK